MILTVLTLLIAASVVLFSVSCVKYSGGTWMVKSAPLPGDWPELSPVGEVVVRQYPKYRAAVVTEDNLRFSDDRRTEPMFMELFGHIKRNEIAMTAPVEINYGQAARSEGDMNSMAFLYRNTSIGRVGIDETVTVRDFEPQTYASVGVRGDYTVENYRLGLDKVNGWLKANASAWSPTAPPRYLGYNGPLTPSFMRYGEVQIPVKPVLDTQRSEQTAKTP